MVLVCATPSVLLIRHIYIYSFKRWGTLQGPQERPTWHTRWSPWLPQVDTDAALWRFLRPSSHSEVFRPYPTSNSSSWPCLNHLMRKVSLRQRRFLHEFMEKKFSSFKVWGLFRLLMLAVRNEKYRYGILNSNCRNGNSSVQLEPLALQAHQFLI